MSFTVLFLTISLFNFHLKPPADLNFPWIHKDIELSRIPSVLEASLAYFHSLITFQLFLSI